MTATANAPETGRPDAHSTRSVRALSGGARHGFARAGASVARTAGSIGAVVRAVAGLIWSVAGPKLSIVAPAGWLALLLAAASLAAGFLLGWQELLFLGFTVLVALVACIPFLFGRTSYGVVIELSPPRVVVGERALGRLVVRNTGTRRLLPARMELPVGAGLAEFGIPALGAGEEHDELFAVPTQRRAVIVAGPAVSVRGDQLGLLRRAIRWADPVDLFVHPRTTPLAPSAAGLVRDLEGQVTKKITNNDLSFHALRNYEPGDDRRYVHWRTSARTGALMVRQFQETRRSQLTVVVSETRDHYASDDEFELAVSVATSIGTQVIRDGTQMNVVSDSRRLRSHSPTALLDDSCRLELRPRRHATARELVRDATRRLPTPSVLIVIAGSALHANDFRSIELLFPADTTMIGIRVAEGEQAGLSLVSAMQFATIGALADLPKVLRRSGV